MPALSARGGRFTSFRLHSYQTFTTRGLYFFGRSGFVKCEIWNGGAALKDGVILYTLNNQRDTTIKPYLFKIVTIEGYELPYECRVSGAPACRRCQFAPVAPLRSALHSYRTFTTRGRYLLTGAPAERTITRIAQCGPGIL